MAESVDKGPSARNDHNLNSINGTDKTTPRNGNDDAGVSSQNSGVDFEYLDTPVKSDADNRQFRVIKLQNGLTALLIANLCNEASPDSEESDHDDAENENSWPDEFRDFQKLCTSSDSNLATCVMYIDAGNVNDPPEVSGISRFTEILGVPNSEKYQESFKDYVETQCHGECHTYVHCEQTEFYFSTQHDNLRRALHLFAESFVSPVIERRTIADVPLESVGGCTLSYDSTMKGQLLENLARDDHPAKKFVRKSFEAQSELKVNQMDETIRNEILKYRKRHYSAHRMTLAVEANLPLHVLVQYVKDCFSNIPNNDLPADDMTAFSGANAFDASLFRKIFKLKPSEEVSLDVSVVLELNWQMSSLYQLYKSKPQHYVSGIMKQEGKGSLITYLRKKKWCLDISTGVGTSPFQNNSMYSLFKINLTLTDEGHKHLKEVLDAIYSYINLMRKTGPQKRIYDEVDKIQRAKFRFSYKIESINVIDYCKNMHFYPPADCIAGSEVCYEYNPLSIAAWMDAMKPESAITIVYDKKMIDEVSEENKQLFKKKHSSREILNSCIEYWKSVEPFPEISIPDANVFVTDDFTVIPMSDDSPKYPQKIHSDLSSEVWYKLDTRRKLPKCRMNFLFASPLPMESSQNAAMMDLFGMVLKRLMLEELYPATAAGLSYQITSSQQGLTVTVHGFNQKLPLLLQMITRYISGCSSAVTEDLFNVTKIEQLKEYYNAFANNFALEEDVQSSILRLGYWSSIDKHTALSDAEFTVFQSFVVQFPLRLYVQALVQGNMTTAVAEENARKCMEILNSKPVAPDSLELKVIEIPYGTGHCRIKDVISKETLIFRVKNYYQFGGTTIASSVLIEFLITFFTVIRSSNAFVDQRFEDKVRQLDCFDCRLVRGMDGVLGYTIHAVKSHKIPIREIDERIETYRKTFYEKSKKLSGAELVVIKNTLLDEKTKELRKIGLKTEMKRNWDEIISRQYVFDRLAREIDVLKEISDNDLRDGITNLTTHGFNLRKLSIRLMTTFDENKKKGIKIDKPHLQKHQLPVQDGSREVKRKKMSEYDVTDINNFRSDRNALWVRKSIV